MDNDTMNTIEYRLTSIEKTLGELKTVIMDTKMQARDINELKLKEDEILQAINAHEKRLRALETGGTQSKADKWDKAINIIVQTLLVACLGIILSKIGLK